LSLLAVEETDVTDAEPTELLSLFLTDDFWTQTLKNQDLMKDILLILSDVHFTDFLLFLWG